MLETWLLMVILMTSAGNTPTLTSHQFYSLEACDRAVREIRATAVTRASPTIHTAVCVPQR